MSKARVLKKKSQSEHDGGRLQRGINNLEISKLQNQTVSTMTVILYDVICG